MVDNSELGLPQNPEVSSGAEGADATAVLIRQVNVGLSSETKYVLLNMPAVGMLAFPIPTAEFIVSEFTKVIARLKAMQEADNVPDRQ